MRFMIILIDQQRIIKIKNYLKYIKDRVTIPDFNIIFLLEFLSLECLIVHYHLKYDGNKILQYEYS